MIKRFLFGIILALGLSFLFTYGQNVSLLLQTDKTDYNIDENINLTLQIQSDQQINAGIVQISGIENFDSFGSSNSTSIQNINGQISMQNKVDFSLKAKSKGTYELGPAEVQIGTGIIKSNIVKINVTGEKMFVGNKPSNFTNESTSIENVTNENSNNNGKLIIGIIVFILVVIIVLIVKIFFKNKGKHKLDKKDVNNQKKIIFPKLDDKHFGQKITKILNIILTEKIGLTTESMTFNEIKNLENRKKLDKNTQEKFEKVFELLRLQKYSQNEVDRKEIVELLKNL